eukprot:6213045-Pleurochrysis_carterae.AAC.4
MDDTQSATCCQLRFNLRDMMRDISDRQHLNLEAPLRAVDNARLLTAAQGRRDDGRSAGAVMTCAETVLRVACTAELGVNAAQTAQSAAMIMVRNMAAAVLAASAVELSALRLSSRCDAEVGASAVSV